MFKIVFGDNDGEKNFNTKEEEFNSFKEDKEKELKKLLELYKDEIAIKAPTTYWKNRKQLNFKLSIGLFFTFIISIVSIYFSFSYFSETINESIKNKDYFYLLKFSFLLLMGMWVLKILIKIMYKRIYISDVSDEKSMFIKTYLSLLSETDALKDTEDRQLILKSIFSPSETKVIQEDNIPLSTLIKLFNTKK